MNRKIAFRAWDGQKLHFGHGCFTDQGSKTWLVHDDNIFPPQAYVQGELMQFTGLLDKNGKEIYEGDVIFAGRFDTKTGEKYVATIAYDDSNRLRSAHKWYIGGYTLTAYKNSISDFDNEEKWEVIGNIYENPNLLTL